MPDDEEEKPPRIPPLIRPVEWLWFLVLLICLAVVGYLLTTR